MTDTFHKDADGNSNPHKFVGKKYFHPKTGHLYQVTGFGIDAQREVWILQYERVMSIVPAQDSWAYFHTIKDFTREGRFLEVK